MDQATFDKQLQAIVQQYQQPKTQQQPQEFDADAYLTSMGFTPPETGLVEGTARSLGRGTGEAVSTVGRWFQSDYGTDDGYVDQFGRLIERGGQAIKGAIAAPVVADPESQKTRFLQAVESTPASLTYSLPAMIGGTVGAVAGIPGGPGTALAGRVAGAAAATAAMSPLMYRDAAINAYRMLKERYPNLPETEIRRLADEQAKWEVGPEAAGNIASGVIFGGTPVVKGAKVAGQVLKDTFSPVSVLKQLPKKTLQDLPFEVGTEGVTGYQQAKSLKDAGLESDIDPLKEAFTSMNVALYMTGGTTAGGAAVGIGTQQLKKNALFTQAAGTAGTFQDNALKELHGFAEENLGKEEANNLIKNYIRASEAGVPLQYNESIFKDPDAVEIVDNKTETDLVTPTTKQPIAASGEGFTVAPGWVGGQTPERPTGPLELTEEDRVVENLPQVRPTGLPPIQSVVTPSEVIASERIDSRLRAPVQAEDALFTQLPDSVSDVPQEQLVVEQRTQIPLLPRQLPQPSDFIITEDGSSLPLTQYNQMVSEGVKATVPTGMPTRDIKAAKTRLVKEGKPVKTTSEVSPQVTTGPMVSTKAGPMPFVGLVGNANLVRVQRPDGKVTTASITTAQREVLKQYVAQQQQPTNLTQEVTPNVEENVQRVPSEKRGRQELEQAQPKQRASQEEVATGGVVQADERKATGLRKVETDIVDSGETVRGLENKIQGVRNEIKHIEQSSMYSTTKKDKLVSEQYAKLEQLEDELESVKPKAKKEGTKQDKPATTLYNEITKGKPAVDVLNRIAKEHSNQIVRAVASVLAKMNVPVTVSVTDLSDNMVGLYQDDTVQLNTASFDNVDMDAVFVHEMVHAAVDGKLNSKAGKIFKTRLQTLKAQLRSQVKDPDQFYALREDSHIEELVTEAMSDKAFQEAMDKVEIKNQTKTVKTLFDKFVDIVRDMLGMASDQHTALKELLAIGTELVTEGKIQLTSEAKYKLADAVRAQTQTASKVIASMEQAKDFIPEDWTNAIKDMVRNPSWRGRRLDQAGKAVGKLILKLVNNAGDRTERYQNLVYNFLTGEDTTTKQSILTIGDAVTKLSDGQQKLFADVISYGDFNGQEFDSLKDVQAITVNGQKPFMSMDKTTFDLYKDIMTWKDQILYQQRKAIYEISLNRWPKKIKSKLIKILEAQDVAESDIDWTKKTVKELSAFKEQIAEKLEQEAGDILKSEGLSSIDVRAAIDNVISAHGRVVEAKHKIGGLKGFMPRVRANGDHAVNVYEILPDGERKRVSFTILKNKGIAENRVKEYRANPKEVLKWRYNPEAKYEVEYGYIGNRFNKFEGVLDRMSIDTHLLDSLSRMQRRGEIGDKEVTELQDTIFDTSTDLILATGGGLGRVSRSDENLEGYKTEDPLQNYIDLVTQMSAALSRAEYSVNQMKTFREINETDPTESKAAWNYITTTLTPKNKFDQLSAKARLMTTAFFMGGSVISVIQNLAQNYAFGVPEISRIFKVSTTEAIKELGYYSMKLTPSNAGGIYDQMKRAWQHMLGKGDIELGRLAEIPKDLDPDLQKLLLQYRKSGLNMDSAMLYGTGLSEDPLTGKMWDTTQHAINMAMAIFKATEVNNRESALVTYAAMWKKKNNVKGELTPEQLEQVYDEAKEFVNQTHFIGKDDQPLTVMKSPVMRTIMGLQNYGVNVFNRFYNQLRSGDKEQIYSALKSAMILSVMGGVFAVPGADDANKVLRRIFKRDLKLEAQQAIAGMSNEEIANFIIYGAPTITGTDMSANFSTRIPFLQGMLQVVLGEKIKPSELLGPTAAIGERFIKATKYLNEGEPVKGLGQVAPEAVARIVRAVDDYKRGRTTELGRPMLFKGEEVQPTATETFSRAFGLQPSKVAEVGRIREAETAAEEMWRRKKSVAISEFLKGNKEALQEFNQNLLQNKQARSLVKPIQYKDIKSAKAAKQPKTRQAFEQQYTS